MRHRQLFYDRHYKRICDRYHPWRIFTKPGSDACTDTFRSDWLSLSEHIGRRWPKRHHLRRSGPNNIEEPIGFLHERPPEMREELEKLLRDLGGQEVPDIPVPAVADCFLRRPEDISGFEVIERSKWHETLGDWDSDGDIDITTAPYIVPHSIFQGACSHAACQMVLYLCPEAKLLGTFDLARIAHGGERYEATVYFGKSGLTPWQIYKVLGSDSTGINSIYEIFEAGVKEHIILDVMADYVRSKCPIIVAVRTVDWARYVAKSYPRFGKHCDEMEREAKRSPEEGERHAIVLIGCSEDSSQFIVHDSYLGPYLPIPTSAIIAAGRKLSPSGQLRTIVAVPKGVARGILWVRDLISARFFGEKLGDKIRLEAELVSRRFLIQEYLSKYLSDISGIPNKEISKSTGDFVDSILRRMGVEYIWCTKSEHWYDILLVDAGIAHPALFGKLSGDSIQFFDPEKEGVDAWYL